VRDIVILACAVDAADKALLPASFMALSQEFGIGPAQLGALTFAQSVAFSIALVLWAPMLRCCSSRDLLAGGCFLWGGLTILIACTSSFSLQFTLRLLVGAALAVVNPVGQALICDVVQESERGRAFGLMQSVSNALAVVVTFAQQLWQLEPFLEFLAGAWPTSWSRACLCALAFWFANSCPTRFPHLGQ